jgi:hypothetical protein
MSLLRQRLGKPTCSTGPVVGFITATQEVKPQTRVQEDVPTMKEKMMATASFEQFQAAVHAKVSGTRSALGLSTAGLGLQGTAVAIWWHKELCCWQIFRCILRDLCQNVRVHVCTGSIHTSCTALTAPLIACQPLNILPHACSVCNCCCRAGMCPGCCMQCSRWRATLGCTSRWRQWSRCRGPTTLHAWRPWLQQHSHGEEEMTGRACVAMDEKPKAEVLDAHCGPCSELGSAGQCQLAQLYWLCVQACHSE